MYIQGLKNVNSSLKKEERSRGMLLLYEILISWYKQIILGVYREQDGKPF